MSRPHPDDVGQPVWLPDFVDAADLDEHSLDASTAWGQDAPPRRAGEVRTSRTVPSSVPEDTRTTRQPWGSRRSSPGDRSGAGRAQKKPKKYLTWAEKQQRREARTEKRREQEAQEREKDPMGFAREIVLSQLAAAPRSRAYLADKLRAKDVAEDIVDAVLDRMEDVGLVDDAAYAGMLVRSQVASRGLARPALARELARKGIEAEDAQEALAQVDDDAERERACEIARKKLATMSRLDAQTRTRRLAGLLARKGYPPALVWSVVKQMQGEDEAGSVDPDTGL